MYFEAHSPTVPPIALPTTPPIAAPKGAKGPERAPPIIAPAYAPTAAPVALPPTLLISSLMIRPLTSNLSLPFIFEVCSHFLEMLLIAVKPPTTAVPTPEVLAISLLGNHGDGSHDSFRSLIVYKNT